MYKKTKSAFTLVELIVVITILTILWTIAFLSFQWYSKSARDSVRISDLKNIRTALELFELKSWKYPDPENNYPVTFSWAEIRTQWIFGEQNLTNVEKLNKLPKDPLFDVEYTYSVLNTKQEFELWAILEVQLEYSYNNILNETNAAQNKNVFNYIKWPYNWKIARVFTWGYLYALNVPSIINWWTYWYDILNLLDEWLMSHNENTIIPWSYSWTITNDWTQWIIVNTWSLVAYEWTLEELNNPDDNTARLDLLVWIQEWYIWTTVEDQEWIKEIIDLWTIDTANPSDENIYYSTLISNDIPWVDIDVTYIIASWWNDWWWEWIEEIIYECNDLIWNANPDQWGNENWYDNFDLCTNTIVLDSINNISSSSNLTGNDWARDIYALKLEMWKKNKFETLWD